MRSVPALVLRWALPGVLYPLAHTLVIPDEVIESRMGPLLMIWAFLCGFLLAVVFARREERAPGRFRFVVAGASGGAAFLVTWLAGLLPSSARPGGVLFLVGSGALLVLGGLASAALSPSSRSVL